MESMQSTQMNTRSQKTRMLVLTGLLFAVSLVLAVLENMIPMPIAVPGVKFGLSNIVVMYALFFVGTKQAYGIAVLKALFVTITRGMVAGALSLSGGLLAITIMLIILTVSKRKASYSITSIAGAISHNIGQFIVISLIYTGTNVWFYFPVLIISGLIAGLLTAGLLRIILPAVKKLV